MSNSLPNTVSIVEMGPRDGLQNETCPLSVEDKVNFINALSKSGLTRIESGSFVSPKWVVQMANTDEVFARISRQEGITYSALTPNLKGLANALISKVDEVAVFGSASESFSQRNINCSIDQSIERFYPVVEQATSAGKKVRGYVSCALGCPYEGEISTNAVARVTKTLLDMGCYEVSIADTIGVGTPVKTQQVLNDVLDVVPVESIAVHFHDTYGQALANIFAALQLGISTIDSAAGGLGGCPYAKGASGNVATEDVLYMLNGMGIKTGVDINKIAQASKTILQKLGRSTTSKVATLLHQQDQQ